VAANTAVSGQFLGRFVVLFGANQLTVPNATPFSIVIS
jgi:hypothetical protein